ncbi:Rho guanyl-nucleotide exchange factor activity [Madurella fahalii]|uniref:Rho guanyl-nucleotide exchange factor activity n=1 Tax=Madurella fahalii TaxID=1157608 RepID=A0ABQ0GAC1_9PEZI
MDPLSVAASVAGLLTAAASISKALAPYVAAARGTPQIALQVKAEIQEASIFLATPQSLTSDIASVPTQQTALIQVDQLVAILTNGVFVFSDLEECVGTLPQPDASPMPALRHRLQWLRKENDLRSILARLQGFKSSVSLILAILQSNSLLQAEQCRTELSNNVSLLLRSAQDLSRRLMNLESAFDSQSTLTTRPDIIHEADDEGTSTAPDLATYQVSGRENNSTDSEPGPWTSGFEFEDDLKVSRPYRRAQNDTMDVSRRSSIALSHALSALTGISLSDISTLSIIALPVYSDEISNSHHYKFTSQELEPTDEPISKPRFATGSLLRECLEVQMQLSQFPFFANLFEAASTEERHNRNHPFHLLQSVFRKGYPLLALAHALRDEGDPVLLDPKERATQAAEALSTFSLSPDFTTDTLPTTGDVTGTQSVGFLKVLDVIKKWIALKLQPLDTFAVDITFNRKMKRWHQQTSFDSMGDELIEQSIDNFRQLQELAIIEDETAARRLNEITPTDIIFNERATDILDGEWLLSRVVDEVNRAVKQEELNDVLADLKTNVLDWKNHNVHAFGALLFYDMDVICTKPDQRPKSHRMYIFTAIILFVREKKTTGSRHPSFRRDRGVRLSLKGSLFFRTSYRSIRSLIRAIV